MLIFILGRLDMSLGASCGPIGRLEPDPVDPAANKHMKEKRRSVEERGRRGEERKDSAFRHQFNEKPSITPGCPGNQHML